MRKRNTKDGISVHGIAGTYVVLLGIDATEMARSKLLGFAIEREDHTERERYWLKGFRTFEEIEPDPQPGSLYSTLEHPIQSFLWGDYTAKPNHKYTYRIRPIRGKPKNLEHGTDVIVQVKTENVDMGEHAIFFNRGVIASQAYARKFQNRTPDSEDLTDKATIWLSRGLMEGALDFISQAKSSRYALCAAVYEFSFIPFLEAFKKAAAAGADVKIIYEAGSQKKEGKMVLTSTTEANKRAIKKVGIQNLVIPRKKRKNIPHNKFIVLLENNTPIEVWTGSTNFTSSGFLGQSNVGHMIRNREVAKMYYEYWKQLAQDPDLETLRSWNDQNTPRPDGSIPRNSITSIFSPRLRSKMLDWYGNQMSDTDQTVMFTAAFGVNKKLAERFAEDKDFLRFIITEKQLKGDTAKLVKRDRDTIIAVGATLGKDARQKRIPGWELDKWYMEEELYRRQGHVFYVHTKYMILDALTDDPKIFTGSANFSENSLLYNDENMLLIRGNSKVADVYLGEFLRLFNHFYFRTVAWRLAQTDSLEERRAVYLDPTTQWLNRHFTPGRFHCLRRELFK
ncbi:MAG: phospholipase D-like domain-containing protein [Candidatus Aminicenantes bacterium]|nr:phospholipase D-like domain-containing protein [Candidatus Aminicenantes bacterium]MDH5385343.1 phospholipase D-like domain-containing protein [Candidatus Aminicenantes bacterium]